MMELKKRKTIIAVVFGGIVILAIFFMLLRNPNDPLAEVQEQHSLDEGEEHSEMRLVHLAEAEIKEFGIEVETAGPGILRITAALSGEVVADPRRLSHIVPYVPGIACEIRKKLGDPVRSGEVLAVLESRALSELKSSFLVSKERLALAEITFQREERLWQKRISSEQDYLEAKKALAEARIELEAAEQKLHSIGFGDEHLNQLTFHSEVPLTRYEIVSPFDGVVIEKHITLGEALKDDSAVFTVADLSEVWVNLTVYQKDLDKIRSGKDVVIREEKNGFEALGMIDWVSPVLDESTRTATARVILTNSDGSWRPGMFVNARVNVKDIEASLVVPRSAVLSLDGQNVVFVQKQEGFEPCAVTVGQSDLTRVEILSGLKAGQRYVTANAFTLKAELGKAGLEEHVH